MYTGYVRKILMVSVLKIQQTGAIITARTRCMKERVEKKTKSPTHDAAAQRRVHSHGILLALHEIRLVLVVKRRRDAPLPQPVHRDVRVTLHHLLFRLEDVLDVGSGTSCV
jgi:hypothetical protein